MVNKKASLDYLENIPLEDYSDLMRNLRCTKEQVQDKAEDLLNYCRSRGKKYKDYKAFLRNALKKDFPRSNGFKIIVN